MSERVVRTEEIDCPLFCQEKKEDSFGSFWDFIPTFAMFDKVLTKS